MDINHIQSIKQHLKWAISDVLHCKHTLPLGGIVMRLCKQLHDCRLWIICPLDGISADILKMLLYRSYSFSPRNTLAIYNCTVIDICLLLYLCARHTRHSKMCLHSANICFRPRGWTAPMKEPNIGNICT